MEDSQTIPRPVILSTADKNTSKFPGPGSDVSADSQSQQVFTESQMNCSAFFGDGNVRLQGESYRNRKGDEEIEGWRREKESEQSDSRLYPLGYVVTTDSNSQVVLAVMGYPGTTCYSYLFSSM